MLTSIALLLLLILYLVAGYLIAKFRGAKRRIGFGWTLFFSYAFSPVAAYFFTTLSPLRSQLPPDDPKDRTGNILLCVLACLWAGYKLGTEADPFSLILSLVGPAGFLYYMATRSARNKQVYEEFNRNIRHANNAMGSVAIENVPNQ